MIVVLAEKTAKIGRRKLWYDTTLDQHFISLSNRTYYSRHEVAKENVEKWRKALLSR